MSTPTLDPTDDHDVATHANAAQPSGQRSLRSVLPWIIAVVAAAVAVFAVVSLVQANADESDEEAIAAAAGRAVTTLTTWNADDLDEVEASVAEFGTDRFQEEARGIFGEFAAGLEEAQVSSQGEVLELAVAEIAGDRAVALASVQQRVTNTSASDQPIESCWGARVTLTQRDGTWLVDRLALFGPNACDAQAGVDG